jgi:hypothetical protein
LQNCQIADYCREIETYLCRKNDGHLIRVVGPSFDLVTRWAADGVPLKIAFRGIDRCVERYYRKGPRRRPVKIDFCEADVLDVFDEWRRAIGLVPSPVADEAGTKSDDGHEGAGGRGPSLPAHLERVLARLTNARVKGTLGPDADQLLDRISTELDAARAAARGVRGEARRLLLDRLVALDTEVLSIARASVGAADLTALEREADDELAAFRALMAADAYARARAAALDRLLRERAGLPVIALP